MLHLYFKQKNQQLSLFCLKILRIHVLYIEFVLFYFIICATVCIYQVWLNTAMVGGDEKLSSTFHIASGRVYLARLPKLAATS